MKRTAAMQKARRTRSGNRVVVYRQERTNQYAVQGEYFALETDRFNLALGEIIALYRDGKRLPLPFYAAKS